MTVDLLLGVVRLALWAFVGSLALSLVLAIALNKTARARASWSLAVLVVFAPLAGWAYYKLVAEPEQVAAQEAMKGLASANEQRERYAKAKALFDERCKTAGEKIYRTAENVQGVLLLNIRQYDVAQSDALMVGAAAAHEVYGDDYIRAFLWFEQEPKNTSLRGMLSDVPSSRPGYRYVETVDPKDQRIYRYALDDSKRLTRREIASPTSRYGVTFEDIVSPEDRKHWVAGSIVKVLDLKTQQTMGEFIRYVVEPGLGSRAGQRTPWLFAHGCAMKTSYGNFSQRFFVDQVLKPAKGE